MNRSSLSRLCAILLAGTAVSSLGASAAFAGPVGSLALLPGGAGTRALGLSADGQTVVGYVIASGTASAAYWSAGGGVSPITIPYSFGAPIPSQVNAASADGSTIVGRYDANTGESGAFVYAQGNFYDLTFANQLNGNSTASGVNADGTVVVGATMGRATMWSGSNWSVATDLGALSPGLGSYALGVDASGSTVVGTSAKVDGYNHAFYWQAGGGMTELVSPDIRSEATAISADASTIIGTYGDAANSTVKAISWTGPGYQTPTDLGTLGGTFTFANAVNADGSVIVGDSETASGGTSAFRYADGSMADLNDLLTGAGVNLGGVTLVTAAGVSADGTYIAANSTGNAYLVFYDDGLGGITNQAEQQASVDDLGKQRQALAIQHDAYAGILTGDLDRANQANDVGVFGLVGSVVGGVHGHLGLGHGFSFSGGLMDGTSSFGGADIGNGFLGAAALRYDSEASLGGFTPYAQIGGSFGVLSNVSFTRDYVGGTGVGTTDGKLASLYARLGITHDFETGDKVSLEAEIGNRWLSTEAYAESFSATNPFPAAIAAGTDRQTIAKLGGSWTHPLSDSVDLTLHAALGTTLDGSSELAVATTGFGTLTTGVAHPVWAELGAHATWAITETSSIDLYATAILGQDSGNNAHVGAGYRFRY